MDRAEVSVGAPIDSNGAERNFCGRRSYTRMGQSSGSVVTEPSVDGADAAMERYANGDEAAFAELYDAVAPRLLGFLRKALRDDSAAEDLMQQALLQIHRARGSFIPGAPVIPWAFAIARRLIIDSARRRRIERRLFADAPADDDAACEPAQ